MRAAAIATTVLLAACATRTEPKASPNLTPLRGQALGEVAQLYGACIAAASRAETVVEVHDAGANLLLFTCREAPAKALYERLGAWSAKIGSAWEAEGRNWRSSAKVQRDLVGVDYCSARVDGEDATCVITLNVGEVLADR